MKLTIRRFLNLILYLSFCVMIGTGLMMGYRIVPGSRGGRGLEVLGWNRHQWGEFREVGRGRQHRSASAGTPESEFILVSSPAAENVTFDKDILPIFDTSCVSCHGPKTQNGGFRADRRADLFRDGRRGPLVVRGNSGESPLVAIVSGARKVKRKAADHILSAKQVKSIRTWIDAGAK